MTIGSVMDNLRRIMGIDIGYNPTANHARFGNPQFSDFGNAIRGGFNPLGGANYEWFPYDPYFAYQNNFGVQQVSISQAEYLYGSYFGYRGIMPLGLQSVAPEPYPYELPYPYNQSA